MITGSLEHVAAWSRGSVFLFRDLASFKAPIPMSPKQVTRLTLAAVPIHNFVITQIDTRYRHLMRADVG